MNSYLPEATHVAVRDGKILGVGSLEDLQVWGEFELKSLLARYSLGLVRLLETCFSRVGDIHIHQRTRVGGRLPHPGGKAKCYLNTI